MLRIEERTVGIQIGLLKKLNKARNVVSGLVRRLALGEVGKDEVKSFDRLLDYRGPHLLKAVLPSGFAIDKPKHDLFDLFLIGIRLDTWLAMPIGVATRVMIAVVQ